MAVGAVSAVVLAVGCKGTDRDPSAASQDDGVIEVIPPVPNRPEDIPPAIEPGDPLIAGMRFTEVSAEAGLNEAHSDADLLAENAMTSGAAVADIDRAGDLDTFLPRVGKPNSLYLNDGTGRFTDHARAAGVAGPSDRFGSATAVFFDIDSDTDLDLYVAGAGQGDNQLFVNDGTGRFTDQTATRGIDLPPVGQSDLGSQPHELSVADVNLDGHLDLLVLHWYHPLFNGDAIESVEEADLPDGVDPGAIQPCMASAFLRGQGFPVRPNDDRLRSGLFLNDGTGHFRNATDDYDLPLDEIVAFTGTFADLDRDGDQDLGITGDGCTSRLFRNDNGERFTDITDTAGVGTDENGMGAVMRDIDRDGDLDWFITAISYPTPDGNCPVDGVTNGCSGNRLYLNNGDLTFRDATDEFGLRDSNWGWGTIIEDLDNDGTPEVIANNGFEEGSTRNPPTSGGEDLEYFRAFVADRTRLWVHDGDTYRDAAAAVGIDDTTIGHALIAFDMDNDGDLDLLTVPTNDTPRLYRNDTTNNHAWITISLHDPTTPGNTWADGATIEITPTPHNPPITGTITTNGSYESQLPAQFHTGLGNTDQPIHRITIHWPDSTTQTLTNTPTRQHLTITREG